MTPLHSPLIASPRPASLWTPGPAGGPRVHSLETAVAQFPATTLEEMSGVALLDRFDTKYILRADTAVALLAGLADDYRALDVAGARLQPYRTVYFDTPRFSLYRAHHSDLANRYKVRSREYVVSGLSFIEIKRKEKRDRTVKERIATAGFVRELGQAESGFVEANTPLPVSALTPTLLNSFRRLTLVSSVREERATLDFGLTFHADGRSIALPNLVVAEVKAAGRGRNSELARALREHGIRPSRFSKYCVGVAMLYPGQKHNRFNPELLQVQRIHEECSHVC